MSSIGSTWTRRRALKAGCLGCATLAVGGCSGLRYVPARLETSRLAFALAEFGEQPCVGIDHPRVAVPIAVCRDADGRLTAVSARCTHKGCDLRPAGTVLACPCHDSTFTWTGEVLGGPARDNLRRFRVDVQGDTVYVGA